MASAAENMEAARQNVVECEQTLQSIKAQLRNISGKATNELKVSWKKVRQQLHF